MGAIFHDINPKKSFKDNEAAFMNGCEQVHKRLLMLLERRKDMPRPSPSRAAALRTCILQQLLTCITPKDADDRAPAADESTRYCEKAARPLAIRTQQSETDEQQSMDNFLKAFIGSLNKENKSWIKIAANTLMLALILWKTSCDKKRGRE